ncbi:MAG: hypothetical protein PHR35_22415, partial [Kiritimatiellae bacterium]|nr:hypothetical protein [Kiritimatiellia bacterium]
MDEVATAVDEIHDAIVGSIRQPGGLAVTVQRHEQDIAALRGALTEYAMQRSRIVAEYDERVTALETWIAATKNKAIGIGIGVALGSAGIGATVGAIVSNLFGGG